jgi:hypothetical protein
MKKLNKAAFHNLFWITIPFLVFYFKWAAQETIALPGLPGPASESFFEIVKNNFDVFIVSLFGSIPVFYTSLYFLTPKLLFRVSYMKIALYVICLIVYSFIVIGVTDFILPMYYFFGTPYAIKVLAPIVLLSALGGTLIAFNEKFQKEKSENKILITKNVQLKLD